MTASTEKKYTNFAQTRLEEGISATDITCLITDQALRVFTGWESGKELYATLVDPSAHREIIKVTGLSGDILSIERGQQSTSARAWSAGTLIEQRPTAGDMSAFIQREAYRSISYNPNGVLTTSYPGEKIYQTGLADCQKRWWKNVTSNLWQLIAGDMCEWEAIDTDPESPTYGYIIPVWYPRFDNTVWEIFGVNMGTWDGTKWVSEPDYDRLQCQVKTGETWNVGYRPTYMRFTFDTAIKFDEIWLYAEDMYEIVYEHNVTSGQVLTLDWTDDEDLDKFYILNVTSGPFNVTNIELFTS